ncbi:hypothetical protein MJ923_06190 [Shewanella sp. 3B26]|uniref:Uncharacterized protein n=1 Tax=Shewanella zhuhaiensis TaxID=2919576 RepID=A0AAJ1BFY1_9GAMM|nr:hypothetical protein [Shewanella zhuhaiensis]MCH4293893.1 hypothetical protein [Shewanella zhuhaiensis]
MKLSCHLEKHRLCSMLFCIVYVTLAGSLNVTMFEDVYNDGFYSQVSYVFANYNTGSIFSPLFVIHSFRLFVVFPFYLAYINGWSGYSEALIYLVYMLPLFLAKDRVIVFSGLLLLFFPLLLSYRTVLGMLGLGYLYICLFFDKGRYFLLIFSALLANLSSGIVVGWIFGVMSSFKYLKRNYPLIIPVFIVMLIGFLGSLVHKYEFMFSSAGSVSNGSFFERSTFYVAIEHQQYSRLFIYSIVTIALLFVVLSGACSSRFSNRATLFFFGGMPLIFFEGVGLISYALCLLIVLVRAFGNIFRRIM